MAVKSFIRGDFRTLIVDNDYPTNYKVFYNGKWNYIQDEESFINKLNPDLGESYLNRFNLKVLDNNQWVPLAILENYYNKNEKRNSIFYRTITRENFIFKPRAVNFTEVDARLGLNNLQTPFVSNETEFEKEEIENITNKLEKDEILYKVGYINQYDELEKIQYIKNEENNFVNDEIVYIKDAAILDNKNLNKQVIDFYTNETIISNDKIDIEKHNSILKHHYIESKYSDIIYNLNTIDNFNFSNGIIGVKNADILKNTEYKSQVINFSNTSIIKNNNVEVNKNFNVLKSSYINN